MLKIYLIGCLATLIIEIVTMIRIRKFSPRMFIAMLFSWLWVAGFLFWVYHIMGWQYEKYGFLSWRIK